MDEKKSYKHKRKVFFVGIGGVSMSSLAVFAYLQGDDVSGSDICKNEDTEYLESIGVKIFYEHNRDNIQDVNLVVYSNATDNSCEVTFAKMLGIKAISRAEFLGEVLKQYQNPICVAGAHGKTTTTALIYNILNQAGQSPSLHLGGKLCSNGKSFCYFGKKYMVCEACEYKDSFLHLPTKIGVVLNVAPEHLDYFHSYEKVVESFNKFANKSQKLVINYDFFNKNAIKIEKSSEQVVTFGLENGNFTAKNIKQKCNGTYIFDCFKDNQFFAHIDLNLVGKHNILNGLASIAVCDLLGIAKVDICAGLQNFNGIKRRYEYLHKDKFLVHDYAHHPEEIATCIKETRQLFRTNDISNGESKLLENCENVDKKKLLIVFQPHTYSRTKTLFDDFVKCFSDSEEVVLLKTFSAREKYDYKGSACFLAKKLVSNTKYIASKRKAIQYFLAKIKAGYGVLFLGAGDIYTLSKIVAKLCWHCFKYVIDFNPLNKNI